MVLDITRRIQAVDVLQAVKLKNKEQALVFLAFLHITAHTLLHNKN